MDGPDPRPSPGRLTLGRDRVVGVGTAKQSGPIDDLVHE